MERCVGTHTEVRSGVLNRVQKRVAKFANNINESGSETLAQNDSPNICPFQGIHWGKGLESNTGQTSETMLPE